VKFAPPKSLPAGETPSVENMKDDATGEPLMQVGCESMRVVFV
jgi:hypothetical protein